HNRSIRMYKITGLIDNYTSHYECFAEHGLSYYIETPDTTILFDTGSTSNIINNADKLNLSLSKIDYLLLSHGHYDHCGGIKEVLKKKSPLKIIAHPDIFVERYSKHDDGMVKISNPFTKEELEETGAQFNLTKESYKFNDNLFTTGEVKRTHKSCAPNMQKVIDNKYIKDTVLDDLSLIITDSEQINIICGCSHSGILNIVEQAINLTGLNTINYIIGGLHFYNMDENELKDTLYELNNYDIRNIAISHCTGINTLSIISDNMASNISYFGISDTIVIQ
ncbi:MAG: MBL fold metallo-hydrolase, partial [Vampirovibrionia bacterium]